MMKRPYLPFFTFLILLGLTIPFSFIFSTDVSPGWHTTIFPLYFIWKLIVTSVLLFVTIGYWLLIKQTRQHKLDFVCNSFCIDNSNGNLYKVSFYIFRRTYSKPRRIIQIDPISHEIDSNSMDTFHCWTAPLFYILYQDNQSY